MDQASPRPGNRTWSLLRLLPPLLIMELCWLGLWLAHPITTRPWPFQALFALAFGAYIWTLLYLPRLAELGVRTQAALVLGVALVWQLTLLPAPFAFSDDIFRYVWDGRVSAAGIDPYRYPPGDAALAPLRDAAIWPFVNAKAQPSPYPPLLEAWFALIYRLCPESLLAMKAAFVLLNMGVIGVLIALLRARRQSVARAIIYAWSPQVALQVAFSGHNEPLLLLWLLLAFLPGSQGGTCGRLIGAWALALATLSKLVPALALPVLFRRWGWRATLVYLATIGAVYGALLLRGQHVFDGVMSEVDTAQFNDGVHYLVARAAQLVTPSLVPFTNLIVLVPGMGTVLLILLREQSDDLVRALGIVLATYVILAASVAPWYTLWILPFVALDALPRLGRTPLRNAAVQAVSGYWLIFSWTAIFSELYYFASRPLWRVAHVLEYLIPVGVMLGSWLWSRRQAAAVQRRAGWQPELGSIMRE